MYLLDTNHFSRLIQQDNTVRQRIAAVGEQNAAISIITAGEVYYMLFKSQITITAQHNETASRPRTLDPLAVLT